MSKKNKAKYKEQPANNMKPVIPLKPDSTFKPTITLSPDSSNATKIGWNFKRMDMRGNFKCTLKLLHDFHDKLVKLEGKTKVELESQGHNHPMSVDKISGIAKKRIENLSIEEDTLYQLDIGTPARLWGVWEHNIFHILWLDPKHGVYLCK